MNCWVMAKNMVTLTLTFWPEITIFESSQSFPQKWEITLGGPEKSRSQELDRRTTWKLIFFIQ